MIVLVVGILLAANSFSPWGGPSRQGYAGAGSLAHATVGAATFVAINVAMSAIGAETNALIAAALRIPGVEVVVAGGLLRGVALALQTHGGQGMMHDMTQTLQHTYSQIGHNMSRGFRSAERSVSHTGKTSESVGVTIDHWAISVF